MAVIAAALIVLPGMGQWRVTAADSGATLVTGNYAITNPTYVESGAELDVIMLDMGYEVEHNIDLDAVPEGVVVGTLKGTTEKGTYQLTLPIHPRGPLFKLDKSAQDKQGLGIYEIAAGDHPTSPDITQSRTFAAIVGTAVFDEQLYRTTGGKVFVWSPDKGEKFPTDFGDDKTLFTDDDPLGEVAAGWSMIDLDQHPFKITRADKLTADLLEGGGALEDYSKLSYSEAWDKLFTRVSTHYPFTKLKKINWKAIHDKVQPMVDAATDDSLFEEAIQAFVLSIPDTHVGMGAIPQKAQVAILGELGIGDMVLTSDGQVVVKYIAPKGPAERAGMKTGTVISQVDNKPVLDVLNATSLVYSGASTPWFKQYEALKVFLRGKVNTKVTLTFQNPGEDVKTADIRRRQAKQYLFDIAPESQANPTELVVTAKVLPSEVGYIKVRNFYQQRPLEFRLFSQAIQQMIGAKVKGIIIDDRDNAGGFGDMGTGMAGFFFREKTKMAERQSVNDKGEFVHRSNEFIYPQDTFFDGPVAVLINANTVSEGDYFAYFMKRAPNAFVVGDTPSSGAEGGIQSYKLPGDFDFQAPEVPAVDDNGKNIIEGKGVEPDIKVSVTADDIQKGNDPVLKAAEDKVLAGGK